MLTADEKILELTHIINEQKQEIEELQETQASISRDEIEYLRRENYDLEVKLSGLSAEVEKYTKEKQSLTGLVEGNLFRLLEQMQNGLQEGSYHQGSLSQDISRLLKAASIFRSVLRGEELPKENQPPDRSASPFKPDIKTNGRTRPLTVDEMIMIKKQEMRKAREGM
jgi:predicted RNase H-like nuclease (RuvC/YqgF family)